MVELRIYKVVSSIISNWLSVRVRFLVGIPFRVMTCLHRAKEDKTVSSVNADIGAESCSVGQDHLSSFREMFLISHSL